MSDQADQPVPSTALATCECAVTQIKPAWDYRGRLVCEDCHGQIELAGQSTEPSEPTRKVSGVRSVPDGKHGRRNSPSARFHRTVVYLAHLVQYKKYGPLIGPKERHQPDPRWDNR